MERVKVGVTHHSGTKIRLQHRGPCGAIADMTDDDIVSITVSYKQTFELSN